jgi:hypothetical protein
MFDLSEDFSGMCNFRRWRQAPFPESGFWRINNNKHSITALNFTEGVIRYFVFTVRRETVLGFTAIRRPSEELIGTVEGPTSAEHVPSGHMDAKERVFHCVIPLHGDTSATVLCVAVVPSN